MAAMEIDGYGYGYVVLTLVFYSFLNFWMAFQVGKARKKYKVFYPTMYASESENKDAKLFNCVQRAPKLAGNDAYFLHVDDCGWNYSSQDLRSLGVVYIIGRYFYFTGYATGDPQNRQSLGRFSMLALMGLMITTISSGLKMIKS